MQQRWLNRKRILSAEKWIQRTGENSVPLSALAGMPLRMRNVRELGYIPARGHEVADGQVMERGMSGDPGKHFEFRERYVQEVCRPLCGGVNVQAGAQLFILRGDADRTVSAAADPVLLTGRRDQGGARDGDRVRVHGGSFGQRDFYLF